MRWLTLALGIGILTVAPAVAQQEGASPEAAAAKAAKEAGSLAAEIAILRAVNSVGLSRAQLEGLQRILRQAEDKRAEAAKKNEPRLLQAEAAGKQGKQDLVSGRGADSALETALLGAQAQAQRAQQQARRELEQQIEAYLRQSLSGAQGKRLLEYSRAAVTAMRLSAARADPDAADPTRVRQFALALGELRSAPEADWPAFRTRFAFRFAGIEGWRSLPGAAKSESDKAAPPTPAAGATRLPPQRQPPATTDKKNLERARPFVALANRVRRLNQSAFTSRQATLAAQLATLHQQALAAAPITTAQAVNYFVTTYLAREEAAAAIAARLGAAR